MNDLLIAGHIPLPLQEIELSAIRAQGPGGQHVNKTATGIQLRFNVRQSSLPEELKQALLALADRRLSKEGVIVIKSQQSRSQEQNRQKALQTLQTLIEKALEKPKPRKATRPTKSAKQKRLTAKTQRGEVKSLRRKITD